MKTHTNHYQNFSLEQELTLACENLTQHVKLDAEDMASRGLPNLAGDHIAPYYENHHYNYQNLIDKINAEMQFTSTCQHVHDQKENAKQEYLRNQNKLSEAKEKHMHLEAKLKRTAVPKDTLLRKRKTLLASAIICLFEGLFSIPFFESLGMNLVSSAVSGLLFAGVLAGFAKVFPRILTIGKTIWQRRLIILIAFLATMTLFTYLGDIRADYLNANLKDLGLQYTAWPFACISELLLITAVAICYFYRVTDEEKEALKNYNKLKSETEASRQEVQKLEQVLVDIGEKIREVHTHNVSWLVFGAMMEDKIIHHAQNSYALFKKHILLQRTNVGRPDCLDEQYPFSFTTHFHTVKQISQ